MGEARHRQLLGIPNQHDREAWHLLQNLLVPSKTLELPQEARARMRAEVKARQERDRKQQRKLHDSQ